MRTFFTNPLKPSFKSENTSNLHGCETDENFVRNGEFPTMSIYFLFAAVFLWVVNISGKFHLYAGK